MAFRDRRLSPPSAAEEAAMARTRVRRIEWLPESTLVQVRSAAAEAEMLPIAFIDLLVKRGLESWRLRQTFPGMRMKSEGTVVEFRRVGRA
jgi:hypothetical protein